MLKELVLGSDSIAALNKDNSCGSIISLTVCILNACNSGVLFELCLTASSDFKTLYIE